MRITKFVIGILTIAVGLLVAGQLAPATIEFAKSAIGASQDQQNFKLGKWNRKLVN